MTGSDSLSAEVLGRIALIQSTVAQLPSKESALEFVCRGLRDVPGVAHVKAAACDGSPAEGNAPAGGPDRSRRFVIELKDHHHGVLDFTLDDAGAFLPYVPFLENLANMLAVIFEERRQRSVITSIMNELEQRVSDRTRKLEMEIVERRQAEAAVALSEKKFRELFREMTSGFALHEMIYDDGGRPADYRFLEVNPAFGRLTGLRADELVGRTAKQVLPNLEPVWIERYGRVASTGRPDVFEEYSAELDRYYQVTAYSPKKDTFAVIFDDQTVRRRAEEALRISEERFRTLAELAPVGVFLTDTDGECAYINEKWCIMTGLSPAEFYAGGWAGAIHPDDREETVAAWREAVRARRDFDSEYRIVARDGTIRWVDDQCTVVHGDGGEFKGHISAATDITSLKRMYGALRSIVEATSPSKGIGFFQDLVSMLARTLGCRSSMVGEIDADDPERIHTLAVWSDGRFRENFHHPIEGTPCRELAIGRLCLYPSGVRESFPGDAMLREMGAESFAGIPLCDSAGEALGVLSVMDDRPLTDIPLVESVLSVFAARAATEIERLRATKIREALLNDLETKNEELERFTYTVSHDLKSPIITITGYLGMIRQDIAAGRPDRIEENLAWIESAATKMQTLLDELLRLSRIGRLVNPSSDVELGDVAREAKELVAGRIGRSNVEVVIEDNLPKVLADAPRMLEVYQNLLDNAVKYAGGADRPRIVCGARHDDGEVVCFVEDNGIGIPARYREKVFGLFDKLDPATEGSGVGLSLVRRIVEHHGGRIWIESGQNGGGTRFCFTLEGMRLPGRRGERSPS